jgi:class 3 adenylate cyclase
MSEKISSEKLVGFLNDMFSKFDDLTESYGVEKIKTIGDSYMVVSGMPVSRKDHALTLFNLAKEMMKISSTFKDHNGDPIKLRIGLNSGPAVSGVIGKSKFAFDVWGDTINTAARLESYGSPDCIHMTKTTYELLNYKEKKVEEKSIEIRGKGLMDTVLVYVE